MTHLERLIKAQTETTTVTTVSRATEKLAEELAREAVKDPAFRAELQAFVRTHFWATLQTLKTNGGKPRQPRPRKTAGKPAGKRGKS